MGAPLATWVVEITSADGAAVLDATLQKVKGSLQQSDATSKATFSAMDVSIAGVTQRTLGLHDVQKKGEQERTRLAKETEKAEKERNAALLTGQLLLGGAYAFVTAKLLGYVGAALSASAEGQRLAFIQERINLEIGGIFAPAIHTGIALLERFRVRLESLSGAEQQNVRDLTGMTLGFTGVYALLPLVGSGISKIGLALQTAFVANPVLGVTAAITGLLLGTEAGREAMGKMFAAALPLGESLAKILTAILPVADALASALGIVAGVLAPVLNILAGVTETIGPTVALVTVWVLLGRVIAFATTTAVAGVTATTAALWGQVAATNAATAATVALNVAKSAGAGLMALAGGPLGLLIGGAGLLASLLGLFGGRRDEQPREDLTLKVGGIESFEASYNRIAQAITQRDTIPAQQLEELRGIRRAVERPSAPTAVVRE